MAIGLDGQKEYSPEGSYQGTISLNLDLIREYKYALFADLYGLGADVILFQDHILSEKEAASFLTNAARKAFRSPGRYCAVVSESPVAPNGQRYGGDRRRTGPRAI